MPDGFPAPTPAPSRTPIEATGGFSFNSSSALIVDASTDGALSGPWFTQMQWLNVWYYRVPFQGADSSDPSSFTLSAQAQSHLVESTELLCRINVWVDKRIDYNYYATNSFWQPQKFALYQQTTDVRGNEYEEPVGYQLGPTGRVYTSQAGYSRVLYDATNPDHVAEWSSVFCHNYAPCVWEANTWTWNSAAANTASYLKMMEGAWADPQGPHSYKVGDSPGYDGASIREWFPLYPIVGGYQTDVEWSGISTLENLVDWIAFNISIGDPGVAGDPSTYMKFFKTPNKMGSSANGQSTLPNPSTVNYPEYHPTTIQAYDWTWHDWT
jgi:hypothetical protein